MTYNLSPNVFVIDNFYNDPTTVRNTALSCEYMPIKHDDNHHSLSEAPWPGKMSVKSYSPNTLDLQISQLLKKPMRQLQGINSGRFRLSNSNDVAQNSVHLDFCSYAGVLYLNDVSNIPGTIFYTHKRTKRKTGTTDLFKELNKTREVNDLSCWDINFISYIEFNRLIIYPANMFHGIGPLFGTTDEDARLVQIFFWETI